MVSKVDISVGAMQLPGAGSPLTLRRRKKSTLNLTRPLSTLRHTIRSSFHFDLLSSPTSPVRLTEYCESRSPTIPEDTQPVFPCTAPVDVPQDGSSSSASSHGQSLTPTSLDSPVPMLTSSHSLNCSTPLPAGGDRAEDGVWSSMKSLSISPTKSDDMVSRSRALSFTTLRRRRSSKIRQTRSTEVSRRSWELEDWEKDLLVVPDHVLSRRNTYANVSLSSLSSTGPPSPAANAIPEAPSDSRFFHELSYKNGTSCVASGAWVPGYHCLSPSACTIPVLLLEIKRQRKNGSLTLSEAEEAARPYSDAAACNEGFVSTLRWSVKNA